MSIAAIDRLDSAEQLLRKAMEAGDPDSMNDALTGFSAALDTVRGVGAWRADPVLKARLRAIVTRLESDQHLSRLMGDLVRQHLSLLAGTTADASVTYGRRG